MIDFVLRESGSLHLYVFEFKNPEVRYIERKHYDEDLHFGEYRIKWRMCLISN